MHPFMAHFGYSVYRNLMKSLFLIPALLLLSVPSFAADATEPVSVVELFTSQGCASCPPVNKFAAKLAKDEDRLVLSYGVTYWDYLGWKDTFGDPKFTKRQREYGKALGIPNIYTPQLILNGTDHSPRYSRKDLEAVILPEGRPEASIDVSETGLLVSGSVNPEAKLIIVRFTPGEQSVPVKRGENGGRIVKLANVVTDVQPVLWDGKQAATQIRPEDGQAYAALFHDPETAEIVTAAVYYP
jgi:hypothetical protein